MNDESRPAKHHVLLVFTDDMKTDLRYAENIINYGEHQLKLIGRAVRAVKTSVGAPGRRGRAELRAKVKGGSCSTGRNRVTAVRQDAGSRHAGI